MAVVFPRKNIACEYWSKCKILTLEHVSKWVPFSAGTMTFYDGPQPDVLLLWLYKILLITNDGKGAKS